LGLGCVVGRQSQQTSTDQGQEFGEKGVVHGEFSKTNSFDYTLKSLHYAQQGSKLFRNAAALVT
jgi:hypothetical protein